MHEKRQRLLGEGEQCRRKNKRMLETSGSREEGEGVATTEVDAQAMGARRLCDARRERDGNYSSVLKFEYNSAFRVYMYVVYT